MWTAARQDGAFTMLSQAYVRWLVVITHPERTNQSCQVKKTTTSSVKSVNPNAENAHLFQKKGEHWWSLGLQHFRRKQAIPQSMSPQTACPGVMTLAMPGGWMILSKRQFKLDIGRTGEAWWVHSVIKVIDRWFFFGRHTRLQGHERSHNRIILPLQCFCLANTAGRLTSSRKNDCPSEGCCQVFRALAICHSKAFFCAMNAIFAQI